MASSISTELQAIFDFIQTDKGIAFAQDIDKHVGTPFYRLKFGTLVKGLVDVAKVLDAAYQAQLGTPPNWGPGVADITALKAVAIADRTDKQSRVVEANGLGGESIYIFDSASTLDGDDVNVVVPALGTGRWILAVQNSTQQLPVINKTGGPLTKGTPCYLGGWDTTSGKMKVLAADAADGTKPAWGILGATLANNAQGVLLHGETSIASSGLDTGASAVGNPVYLASGGGMTLTPPSTGYVQIVARVVTTVASGTVRVAVEPMRIPPAADTDKPGLLSAAFWNKLNRLVGLDATIPTPRLFPAGTDVTDAAVHKVTVKSKVTRVTIFPTDTWTIGAGETSVWELKNATTAKSLATKTFADAPPVAGTGVDMTLNVTPAELVCDAGDVLTLTITNSAAAQVNGCPLQIVGDYQA